MSDLSDTGDVNNDAPEVEGVTDAPVNPEGEGTPTPKVSFKDFVDDPEFQKFIQSEADRRAAKALATERKKQAEATQALRRRQALEEEDRLAEEGEFEELGKRTVRQKQEQKVLSDAITLVAETIESEIRSLPEVQGLGEDVLNELTQDILTNGGDLITFIARLLGEKESRTKQLALSEAQKNFDEELEATLKEYGVERRTKEAETGDLPPAELATRKQGARPRGYVEASNAYINGELSVEEFAPYLEAHLQEKGEGR
jgi:hypothetical protein